MTKIIWYNELAENIGNIDIEKRELKIKETAEKICKTRRDHADSIKKDIDNIRVEDEQIEKLIRNIRDNYGILDEKDKQDIETKCHQLEESIRDYIEKCEKLCARFKNQKIKVVAFGPKSQGKSTFTSLYTGLDHAVVAVKQAGNDDKTGATSVILHSGEEKGIEIRVLLKSQEEILSMINSSLNALRELNLSIPGTNNNGIYNSWDDFMDIMKNQPLKKRTFENLLSLENSAKVENFTSNCAVLKSVFRTPTIIKELNLEIKGDSDFSEVLPKSVIDDEVKKHGQKIKLNELPMYNDMQYEGNQRFMTVSLIKIFKNLGRQNMFENFEICDTKGLSEDAGGSAHEDSIYKELNEADAAFSIFMLKTGDASQTFYENLAKRIHSKDSSIVKPSNFASKHFVILNVAEDGFTKSVPTVAIDIRKQNDVASKVYIGALKNNSYDGKPIDAKCFVDSLILDMLETIVFNTKENDNSLIKECNEMVKSINASKDDLIKCLSQIQIKEDEYNIDNILLEKIQAFCIAAIEKLEKMASSHNIILPDIENGEYDTSNTTSYSQNNDDDDDDEDHTEETNEVSSASITPMPMEHLSNSASKVDPKRNVRIFKMITARPDMDEIEIEKKLGKCTSVSDAAISDILDNEIKSLAGSNVYMGENIKYALKVKGSATDIGGYIDSVSALLYEVIKNNINIKYIGSQDIDSIISLRDELYSAIWEAFKFSDLYGAFNENVLKANIQNEVIDEWLSYYSNDKKDPEASAITPEVSYNILIAYFKELDFEPASKLGAGTIINWESLKQAICKVYRRFNFEGRVLEKLTNEEKLKRNIFVQLRASLMNEAKLIGGIIGMYPKNPDELLNKGIITADECKKISDQYKWGILHNTREQLDSKRVTPLSVTSVQE